MLAGLPVMGVCGWSGSGKTTLIEAIIPPLRADGLKVAVVKHDVHGIDLDLPGKDSDRLFRAGADVLLQGPGQDMLRSHHAHGRRLHSALRSLCRQYDLVLVEGHKGTPLPKLWLLRADPSDSPPGVEGIVAAVPWGPERVRTVLSILAEWLPQQWLRTPVYGCVLIRNARGIERAVKLLDRVTKHVVIVGARRAPEAVRGHTNLADVVDADGPIAGVLAAMRWAPRVSWLVATSDLPDLTPGLIDWLLATRAPGVWATLPEMSGGSPDGPSLAHYDFRSRALLEPLAAAPCLTSSPKVISPSPPPHLRQAADRVEGQGREGR